MKRWQRKANSRTIAITLRPRSSRELENTCKDPDSPGRDDAVRTVLNRTSDDSAWCGPLPEMYQEEEESIVLEDNSIHHAIKSTSVTVSLPAPRRRFLCCTGFVPLEDTAPSLDSTPCKQQSKTRRPLVTLLVLIVAVTVTLTVVAVVVLTGKSEHRDGHASTAEQQNTNCSAATLNKNASSDCDDSSPDLSDGPPTSDAASYPPSQSFVGEASSPPDDSSQSFVVQTSSPPAARPTDFPTWSVVEPFVLEDTIAVPSPNPHSPSPTTVTYVPGQLAVSEAGLLLSQGLTARVLARSGEFVQYESDNGNGGASAAPRQSGQSRRRFHHLPDFGGTFVDRRPENPGGWIYVSNSEIRNVTAKGGVGALTFDALGRVRDYRLVLANTTANCGGGSTPWGAWISCEEYSRGRCWQVDPVGDRVAVPITLGSDYGVFESFAHDVRNREEPSFFITEDHKEGPMQRFTPFAPDWEDPWTILTGDGDVHYLLLLPEEVEEKEGNSTSNPFKKRKKRIESTGTYAWTTDKKRAKANAAKYYPNSEGIDVYENQLFFVSKVFKTMYILDLDSDTYKNSTTRHGMFDGGPDQLQRLVHDSGKSDHGMLYYTEEGGRAAGVHSRDGQGRFVTILESDSGHYNPDETTGLAFSPGGRHLYVAYQESGVLLEVSRQDGLPFHAVTLNVKYHNTALGER